MTQETFGDLYLYISYEVYINVGGIESEESFGNLAREYRPAFFFDIRLNREVIFDNYG